MLQNKFTRSIQVLGGSQLVILRTDDIGKHIGYFVNTHQQVK